MPCVHGYENSNYCRACNAESDADWLRGELDAVTALLTRCRKVLERAEWGGLVMLHISELGIYNHPTNGCAVCGNARHKGHAEGCELAALLQEITR